MSQVQRTILSRRIQSTLIIGLAAGALAAIASTASATPTIMNAFSARYPTTTLLQRTAAATGDDCLACHSPPNHASKGNCYRAALKTLIQGGMNEVQAINALDAADSDNDGTPNGVEITMARTDMPGEIGYNPGLVGSTGVSPCSAVPTTVVTNQLETPPPPCPADLANGTGSGTPDGGVDINDLLYFLAAFEAGSTAADLDNGSGNGIPDGGIDINDLLFFLTHFELGC